jgi:hypothetical protein
VASDFRDHPIGGIRVLDETLGVRSGRLLMVIAQEPTQSLAALHRPLFQLGFQDAVFGGQIFVPRQQLLVYRPGDAGQDARPIHNGPLAQSSAAAIIDRPKIYRTATGTATLAVDN